MDENTNLNIYSLSRYFWDFAFENPVKIKPIHCSIYFFAVEHCNRLGWKKNFGLPTSMVIEAIGVKSYSVYKSAFDDLVSFGFFEIIQYSKNQYSSNVIALKENDKANSKALDKALVKHVTKQCESTVQSIDSIIIQLTSNKEQLTNKQLIALRKICESDNSFNFKSELIKIGVEENVAKDWLSVRSKKRGSNTETAFNDIKKQIELSGLSANECIKTAVIKNWVGFEALWLANIKSSSPLPESSTLTIEHFNREWRDLFALNLRDDIYKERNRELRKKYKDVLEEHEKNKRRY